MKLMGRPRKYALLLCSLRIATGMLSSTQQPDSPHVTAVEPKAGVTTPGSKVIVYGTGFSNDAVVYFGGLQVRETKFVSPSTLEAVTPYLRPGRYAIQVKSQGAIVRSEVTFTALQSPIDSEIDRAVTLAKETQTSTAVSILTNIAKTNSDYQVRAFAYYQIGQIYLAAGDLQRWGWTLTFLDADKSGMAVQTSWRYGLDEAQRTYFLNLSTGLDYDLRDANVVVASDVTENPEPRFFRALINARYGNLQKAKVDSDSILKLEPDNQSYRALAAYIAVLSSDKSRLQPFIAEQFTDARALGLLGEAAYLAGDFVGAQLWWTQEARAYPLGASLAFWAGKKHMALGQRRIAEALLAECMEMAPDSKRAKEARDLLATAHAPGP